MKTVMKFRPADDLIVAGASLLVIAIAAAALLDIPPKVHETTFIDAIPPEEFLANPEETARRHPSNIPLPADQLVKTKKYGELNSHERRSIYNAVIYFCNEQPDPGVCEAYVKYCG